MKPSKSIRQQPLGLDGLDGGSLLSGGGNGGLSSLGNLDVGSSEDNLDVARVSLVGVDSTVSSESSSVGLGGLLDDDVLDDELLGRELLGLSVGLGVLEQSKDESNGLLRPST